MAKLKRGLRFKGRAKLKRGLRFKGRGRYSRSEFWRPNRGPILLYTSDQIRSLPAKRKRRKVSNSFSDFKNQLIERKKFTILYGNLTKKQLKKACYKASQRPGRRNEELLLLLETRLDVVLYRTSFFKTIHSARQWINHNRITVNGQTVHLSSYAVKPGDVVSVTPKRWGAVNCLETKRRGVGLSSCWCANHKPTQQPVCTFGGRRCVAFWFAHQQHGHSTRWKGRQASQRPETPPDLSLLETDNFKV